jgi:LuxR family maltose regulon positive regulatory protein
MVQINRINVRIEILALLALLYHKQNDQAAATEHLQAAIGLAEPEGWIRSFVDLGRPMVDLLKFLIQDQPDNTYAQQVLKAFQAECRKIAPSASRATAKPRISEQPPDHGLTRREIEILPLLDEGLSNREIAARLYIAPVTVKTHLQNIYKKLNVNNRIEALKKLLDIGISIDY